VLGFTAENKEESKNIGGRCHVISAWQINEKGGKSQVGLGSCLERKWGGSRFREGGWGRLGPELAEKNGPEEERGKLGRKKGSWLMSCAWHLRVKWVLLDYIFGHGAWVEGAVGLGFCSFSFSSSSTWTSHWLIDQIIYFSLNFSNSYKIKIKTY